MPFTRETPLTFIVPQPLLLRIERIDKPGAAPGDQPVAFTKAGPKEILLAVNAYPARLVNAFFESDAFGEAVIVVGAAWEEDGGVRGELSALLPQRALKAIQESVGEDETEDDREPWAASASLRATSYEDVTRSETVTDEPEPEAHFPLVIGAVLRFPENRKFREDFELEVDDLIRSILDGNAMDAGEKRIDNLLGGM